ASRLHDPLNDVSNLREAAEVVVAAERDFEAGLVYCPGLAGAVDTLIERARALPERAAVRTLLHDPTGSLQPPKAGQPVGALGARATVSRRCARSSTASAPRWAGRGSPRRSGRCSRRRRC